MRRVVTGVDDDGRSTIVSDGAPPVVFLGRSGSIVPELMAPGAADDPPGAGEAHVAELWALARDPVVTTEDPTAGMTQPTWTVPPGATRWLISRMGPGLAVPGHRTDSIDYGIVVAGEVELGLDTGPVQLRAGDMVVVNGVVHTWRTGPEGCTIATVMVGLPPA